MADAHNRTNLVLLATGQALLASAVTVVAAAGSLIGFALASDKALATLPLAMMIVGTSLGAIPASLLMKRIGRRAGFMLGASIGVAAGIGACVSLTSASFLLFCASTTTLGVSKAFASYYRFAAADSVPPEKKGHAISLVLAGGVIAGVIGPTLAKWSRTSVAETEFLGSMMVLCALMAASLAVVSFLRIPAAEEDFSDEQERPLRVIMRSPTFVVAVLGATIGGAVMTLIMTATPLAMDHFHHDFDQTADVIQWHVVAMFLPSFVTGSLIKRWGVSEVMLIGAVAMLATVAIAVSGTDRLSFSVSLILLGVGWNFLFVGGSTLLTSAHNKAERAKTQAANDFILFTCVAGASLGSGQLLHHFGWRTVNFGALPAIAIVIGALLWHRNHSAHARTEPSR